MTGEPLIAAGGVVIRDGDEGPEVLLVRRPHRRNDWSLPKGKFEPFDADLEACAVREVAEETGFTCRLGALVDVVSYTDHLGRMKNVTYYAMSVVDGAFVPNAEVDAVAWLSFPDARAVCTYDTDRSVLAAFELSVRSRDEG